MVLDSWEMSPNLQGDAVMCQDQCGTNIEGQISVVSTLRMILLMYLTGNQHGSKNTIGSH